MRFKAVACPPPPPPSPEPSNTLAFQTEVRVGRLEASGVEEGDGVEGDSETIPDLQSTAAKVGRRLRFIMQVECYPGPDDIMVFGQVFHEDLSKFLTAWTCNFPASENGKRRRPRVHTDSSTSASSMKPAGSGFKRARSSYRSPAIAPPDSNLDDYAQQSREALDELIKHEAERFALRQAALEQQRAAREERRQQKRAQQLARLEKQREAKLARASRAAAARLHAANQRSRMEDASHYYASEEEAEGDGASSSHNLPLSLQVYGIRRSGVSSSDALRAEGQGASASAGIGFRMGKRTNRWGREVDKKPTRKEGGARKLLDSMMQRLSGNKAHRDPKWAAAAKLAGKKAQENGKAEMLAKGSHMVAGDSNGLHRLGGGVEDMERAVQGSRADRGQHKKYVGARVEVKIQGQWRPGAVTSHLLSHPRAYSIVLDDGTRLDLKLPNDKVRMILNRAPLTTVTDNEREFARLANIRLSGTQQHAYKELEVLVAGESVGCRARVLYDMGNWHCGWIVSYSENLEGSSSNSSQYLFRLHMDDNDFEEVFLPSPDGDVEIIPGFRRKYHEAIALRPSASILEALEYRRGLSKMKDIGETGIEAEVEGDGIAGEELADLGEEYEGQNTGRHHTVRSQVGLVQRGLNRHGDRRGATSWNRFLIQKKGLGLNQSQLKSLYKCQMQSRDFLKARGARHSAAAAGADRRDRFLPNPYRPSGSNEAGYSRGCSTQGAAFKRGILVKGARPRDRRKDSSWNFFLGQHKGLGMTRAELKAMYRRSIYARHGRDQSDQNDGQDEDAHDGEDYEPWKKSEAAGAGENAEEAGVGGMMNSADSSIHSISNAANSAEQDFGQGRMAWNRFMKSKRGLGLNRAQLKVLYRQQLFLYRARNASGKARGRGGRVARGQDGNRNHAGDGAGDGGSGRGWLLPQGGSSGGRADSPWNKFLIANKGLGLKRAQLQALYQNNHSRDPHELSSNRMSSFDTHASRNGAGGSGVAGQGEVANRIDSAAASKKQRPVNQINVQTLIVIRRHPSVTDAAQFAGIAKSRCGHSYGSAAESPLQNSSAHKNRRVDVWRRTFYASWRICKMCLLRSILMAGALHALDSRVA